MATAPNGRELNQHNSSYISPPNSHQITSAPRCSPVCFEGHFTEKLVQSRSSWKGTSKSSDKITSGRRFGVGSATFLDADEDDVNRPVGQGLQIPM